MDYPYKENWWETKDHKKLKIEDMETSHIENTIRYLKKHRNFYDEEFGGYVYDDGEPFYYCEDNSHLVEKKIEELEYELNKRKKLEKK